MEQQRQKVRKSVSWASRGQMRLNVIRRILSLGSTIVVGGTNGLIII